MTSSRILSLPLQALALVALSTLPALAQTAAPPAAPVPPPTPPNYAYTFTPPSQGAGTPQILKVELNSDHLHAGGPIAIRVTTTPDVVKVTTGNGKRSGQLTQSAPGIFTSESTLPHAGGIASLRIKLHFQASTASGTSISVDVPVSYR